MPEQKNYLIFAAAIALIVLVAILVSFSLKEKTKKSSEQETAVAQALQLYQQKKSDGMNFLSQCLGIVGDLTKYAVDIVHVPRSEIDNMAENQCLDYIEGKVNHFIELDKDGNIVRIA